MDKHFDVIQKIMKEQLRGDQFDDFGLPVQDTQRLIGRIINLSIDEAKLNESNIGLLNLSDENGGGISKIKLQLGEVKSYSFYEGEIVVAEGTYDSTSSKLNVQTIHKPTLATYPRDNHTLDELKQFSTVNYKDRAI